LSVIFGEPVGGLSPSFDKSKSSVHHGFPQRQLSLS